MYVYIYNFLKIKTWYLYFKILKRQSCSEWNSRHVCEVNWSFLLYRIFKIGTKIGPTHADALPGSYSFEQRSNETHEVKHIKVTYKLSIYIKLFNMIISHNSSQYL